MKQKIILEVMKNRIHLTTDGINVSATLEVQSSKIGTRVLSIMIVLEIIIFSALLSQLKSEELGSMIFPIIIVVLLFIGLPIKYLLWNLYGKEKVIFSTKSVSWSYDYGFFQTNLSTKNFDRLGTGYEKVQGDGDNELGRLMFYNYNKTTDLPELIHQTTVLLKKEEIKSFDNQISELFDQEFLDKNGFIPFSLN